MTTKELTTAYITKTDTINIPAQIFANNPNLLVIESIFHDCMKITIYPIESDEIVKITFTGSDLSDNSITDLLSILHNYKIIHTSGLIIKDEEFYYECYLNLSHKTKDLKGSLDKIRNIFKEITIDTIELKIAK